MAKIFDVFPMLDDITSVEEFMQITGPLLHSMRAPTQRDPSTLFYCLLQMSSSSNLVHFLDLYALLSFRANAV